MKVYLVFIAILALIVSVNADVPCPFGANLGCTCTGDCPNTTVFQSVTCRVPFGGLISFNTPPATFTVTEELHLTGYVWELKENAFSAFRIIGQLTLEQLPAGYVVNWHPDAFKGVKIQALTAINLNNAERKAEALRNLGKNGLEGLRVVNAYGEEKLNLSSFEMREFRKLTTLSFEHTPIGFIDDNAFSGLEYNLERLSLVGTELGVYPKNALKRLSNLRLLDLTNNNMVFPHGSTTFENLTELNTLIVAGNDMNAAIKAGAMDVLPPKLTVLDMSRAQLQEVTFNVLKAAPMLDRLVLADNFIHILQPLTFNGRKSMLDAYAILNSVDTNETTTVAATTSIQIPTTTRPPPLFISKLTYLNLDGNPITQIIQGAMEPFPMVTEFSMKRTPLIAIDLNAFEGMNQLKLLWMDTSQRLRLFANSGQGIPSLNIISLVNSALDTIEPDLDKVVSQPQFQMLDLSNNEFLLCGQYVAWTAKHVLCQPQRIRVDGSKCADMQEKLLLDYLKESQPNVCGTTTESTTPPTPPPPPPPPAK